ncbi:MAG: GntR family transcriptional regulator [Terrisporobacter othiniensis]|uniref:GntR family transcriptional regulator n=2 Tax=Clostridia TaxID=186801 RepID=A0AAX2ZMU0_9FIRM|nr:MULTISPECIES: GntR family transcriptional regulator [Terrisporobacter]MDU4862393.1 GntR family transcriptional regulator [Terrisporobacter othiniensis]MDU6996218.1 GntR family transcriptional regulator [Terrisporobacter othiniensis]UEL49647.1 GntR family transcriptional regulator [Terrisporobacter hibernicus]SFJ69740.1 DNA-binding transcriptional regulator, GntR family [Terrisporobacter glycolicus]
MDSLTKLNLDNYKPLRDVVFENLRTAILEGNLKAGKRLMEVQLAEQLGVSRTPIREAIRKLELEGLVVMLPRKGAYVANMSFKDLIDVLEIRASLEGLAASLASERLRDEDIVELERVAKEFEKSVREADIDTVLKKDVEFHEKIFLMANNKKLYHLITSLWEQVHRFRVTYVSNYEASLSLVDEHNRILEAIKSGDSELAKKYATEHIELAEQFFMDNTVNN